MINPDSEIETANRPYFAPRVLAGGLMLDLERLTQTMAMLEDYVDSMLVLDEPLPLDPVIGEEEIQLRVASL